MTNPDQERLSAEAKLDARLREIGGCTNAHCMVVEPVGMHTNGGCKCLSDRFTATRVVHAYREFRRTQALTPEAGLRELIQTLIDNDPNELVSDAGHSVLDVWRHDAKRALGSRPTPVEEGWRPISEAPMDGTQILVWGSAESSARARPHTGSEDVERVFWRDDYQSWEVCSPQVSDLFVPEPTHWMPLPKPPSLVTRPTPVEEGGV